MGARLRREVPFGDPPLGELPEGDRVLLIVCVPVRRCLPLPQVDQTTLLCEPSFGRRSSPSTCWGLCGVRRPAR